MCYSISRSSSASQCRIPYVIMLAVAALPSFQAATAAAADPKDDNALQSLISNVIANEQLYADIDVAYENVYSLHEDLASQSSPAHDILTSSKIAYRSVTQSKLFYLSSSTENTNGNGEKALQHLQKAYDGEATRSLQGAAANLHKGRAEPARLFRPHTILLSRAFVHFPLSLYFEGGDRVSLHQFGSFYKTLRQKTFFDGDEVVNNLTCSKVRCETWPASAKVPSAIRWVWLAKDRNYLPVKTIGYAPKYSLTIPLEEGVSTDFRELKPGIWLPFKHVVSVYSPPIGKNADRKLLSNVDVWLIHSAHLDPSHDVAFFRSIPFPKGTAVYEVDGNQIVSSRVEGDSPPPAGPAPTQPRSVITVAILAVISLFAILVIYIRARWSRQHPPPHHK